jgi:hypothetical protein
MKRSALGSAFNAEFFAAARWVAKEFDLFGQRRSPDASGLG